MIKRKRWILISITHNIKTLYNLLVFNTEQLQWANSSCRQLWHLQEQPRGGKKHVEKWRNPHLHLIITALAAERSRVCFCHRDRAIKAAQRKQISHVFFKKTNLPSPPTKAALTNPNGSRHWAERLSVEFWASSCRARADSRCWQQGWDGRSWSSPGGSGEPQEKGGIPTGSTFCSWRQSITEIDIHGKFVCFEHFPLAGLRDGWEPKKDLKIEHLPAKQCFASHCSHREHPGAQVPHNGHRGGPRSCDKKNGPSWS